MHVDCIFSFPSTIHFLAIILLLLSRLRTCSEAIPIENALSISLKNSARNFQSQKSQSASKSALGSQNSAALSLSVSSISKSRIKGVTVQLDSRPTALHIFSTNHRSPLASQTLAVSGNKNVSVINPSATQQQERTIRMANSTISQASPSPKPTATLSNQKRPTTSPSKDSGYTRKKQGLKLKESRDTPISMAAVAKPSQSSAPSSQGGNSGSSCFPADATVSLKGKTVVKMEELVVGDEVLVGNDEYSRVIDFSHADRLIFVHFHRFTTTDGKSLVVTPCHFIYTQRGLVTAAEVSTNDYLIFHDGKKMPIFTKDHIFSRGLFNPHTSHGDIAVNGFKVSTYTTAVKPMFAHALLAPIRLLDAVGIRPSWVDLLVRQAAIRRLFNILSA